MSTPYARDPQRKAKGKDKDRDRDRNSSSNTPVETAPSIMPQGAPPAQQKTPNAEKTGHWKVKCRSRDKQSSSGQHAPWHNKGGKYRQKQILDVGTDDDPHYDDVRVAAVLNEVGTGMATALNQVGEVAVPHSTQPLWLDNTITIADVKTNGTEAFATVELPADIGKCRLATLGCKVDTGAGGNVMPLRAFSKLFPERFNTDGHPTGLTPSTTRLSAYNGSTIKQYGTLDTHIDWTPKGTKTTNRLHTWWFVADTPGPAILGLPACHRLRIVELNCAVNLLQKKLTQQKTSTTERQKVQDDLEKLNPFSSREDLINAYPDRFEGTGHFPGTYHITLQKDARPVVHAPRKCPIAMRPLVHEKLDEWLKEGIITPVEEPTDWVSSLAYSHKANGKLWICLDPKDLNATIKRDHYETPTVEEITHELAGSRKFTKLDGTSSYLCIVLDYESSLLTTFNTPWGRYRFIRLPFGLACSQDIFQRMMDQILERCEGVIRIADDVVVHGKDDEEHDRRLHNLMRVTREHGLVFNREKCDVKTTSVTFFGTVYNKNGAHPDPKKVEAIHKMPPPEEPQELQKFLGMTTYLSPFIPSLSTFTASLRELLWKDSEFTWNDSYQEAFDAVKQMVCKDTTLRYFDSRKPIVIQVDASQKGLGAALLQDGHPVAFTSKALTPTEQWYANIECEMLACVFGAERFHTYVFSRSFTIESDHKPLEQINLKNLTGTPARLQRMLLHLQNYDVKITYRPGREMLVADTLSRVPWLKPSLLDGLRI